MKKLLILAYDFPPYVSVGGQRPYSWYKELKKFGVHPIVVTRQWKNEFGNELDYISASETNKTIVEETEFGTLISTPYKANFSNRLLLKYGANRFKRLRKIYSGILEILQYYLPLGTKKKLYTAAKEFLKENKVDAIIATADPFVLFHYASKLSKEFDIPWIADYRDLWSQNHVNQKKIFARFEKNVELRSLRNTSMIIGVSKMFNDQLNILHKKTPKTILINGYNSTHFDNFSEIKQNSEVFTIILTGSIFEYHPLESFLEGLLIFKNRNPQFKFQVLFYGVNNVSRIQTALSDKFTSLKTHVEIYKSIPNEEIVKELLKSNTNLLFTNYCNIGTKIYDYLAAKRPILFCFTEDEAGFKLKEQHFDLRDINSDSQPQVDMIRGCNAGYIVKDKNELPMILEKLYREWEKNGELKIDSVNIEQFSRSIQTKKLADLIKEKF